METNIVDFYLEAIWCEENNLYYTLNADDSKDEIVFYVTIYSRDDSGEIDDFVSGSGKNKHDAMRNAKKHWMEARPITSSELLRISLDFINQINTQALIVEPTKAHTAPFDNPFPASKLIEEITNHLKK
jgi:hypothetical protein